MRHPSPGPVLAAVLTLVVGCGGEEPVARTPPPVALELVAPADASVVRAATVEVRGRVEPARARVLVGGRRATVSGGEFTATVPLREGANLIDVAASARGASAAWSALRVTRKVTVTVPDLVGMPLEEAEARLDALGLRAQDDKGGGLLETLLPGAWEVCETRPAAGAEVRRGSEVRLAALKGC